MCICNPGSWIKFLFFYVCAPPLFFFLLASSFWFRFFSFCTNKKYIKFKQLFLVSTFFAFPVQLSATTQLRTNDMTYDIVVKPVKVTRDNNIKFPCYNIITVCSPQKTRSIFIYRFFLQIVRYIGAVKIQSFMALLHNNPLFFQISL